MCEAILARQNASHASAHTRDDNYVYELTSLWFNFYFSVFFSIPVSVSRTRET